MTRDQARLKAKNLVLLAAHSKTPKHEAENAAVRACKYIRKYKLLDLDNPLEAFAGTDVGQAVKAVADVVSDPRIRAAGKTVLDGLRRASRR